MGKKEISGKKDFPEMNGIQKNIKEKNGSGQMRKLAKAMEEVQDGKRYFHTLGVSFTACSLAMCHGLSVKDAQIAGLLHDCAKCLSDDKLISICEKNDLEITEIEMRNPYLLHGKVGAFLAATKYQIEDQDIQNAIYYHTTGRPGMSPLEQIIFIADYIEPGRKQAPNLDEIRKLSFEDLDLATLKILEDTLNYLESGEREIDPMTKMTYDFYLREVSGNN